MNAEDCPQHRDLIDQPGGILYPWLRPCPDAEEGPVSTRYRVPVRVLIAVGDAEPDLVATGTLTDTTDMGAVLRDMADAYDRAAADLHDPGAR